MGAAAAVGVGKRCKNDAPCSNADLLPTGKGFKIVIRSAFLGGEINSKQILLIYSDKIVD